jgi:5-methyltetrahydrofolate--homocysteine methyltransferase
MVIVGERINSSSPFIASAIESRDKEKLQTLALKQAEAGAAYIDINAGTFGSSEGNHLRWLVEIVQEAVEVPCCIDTPSASAAREALAVHEGPCLINSITLERERYTAFLPLIKESKAKVVALCIDDEGIPPDVEKRLEIASRLVEELAREGIPPDHMYIDPLVQPLGTNPDSPRIALEATERIMASHPGVHTICGISNVSFALPVRGYVNCLFLAMAMSRGLDAAILNPCDEMMRATLTTARALVGEDPHCLDYLSSFRRSELKAVT